MGSEGFSVVNPVQPDVDIRRGSSWAVARRLAA